MDVVPTADNSSQASELALRVALQTMKERCIALQHRLTTVEEENQQLRELNDAGLASSPNNHSGGGGGGVGGGGVAENFQLRLQVSELQRQKTQLSEHINMVSSENRKLWSRLSQMTKEQQARHKDSDGTLANDLSESGSHGSPRGGAVGQNLVRSKTFTQHSPNPHLRHKLISPEIEESGGYPEDLSVVANGLDVYGKRNHEHDDEGDDGCDETAEVALGFAYPTVDETSSVDVVSNEQDFNVEAKRCIEGLQEMRREAMKQQQELNSVFSLLEGKLAVQPCPECANKSPKPEMADKSLETDESLSECKNEDHIALNQLEESSNSSSLSSTHLNVIDEKIQADAANKMCPMCGKIYDSQVSFQSFCEHVEQHFIDDNIETEHSIEHNFELISHAVGDF